MPGVATIEIGLLPGGQTIKHVGAPRNGANPGRSCLSSVCRTVSQTRIKCVQSPDNISRPASEKVTLLMISLCPLNRETSLPVKTSQTRTVQSSGSCLFERGSNCISPAPETASRPSGENATLLTGAACPRKRRNSVPFFVLVQPELEDRKVRVSG